MLAMGRALMGAPKLLMLDEPSLGLAPIIVADIFRIVGELRAAGVSVLLVEQNAQAALQIADRAYVMELGEFILNGTAKDIASNTPRRGELSRLHARGRERDLGTVGSHRKIALHFTLLLPGRVRKEPALMYEAGSDHFELINSSHIAGTYFPSFTVRMIRERSSSP